MILRYGEDDPSMMDGRPTYVNEHRRRVAEQAHIRDALECAIAAYEKVIGSWSPAKYPTTSTAAKAAVVHMERPVKTIRGEIIGTLCRGVGRGRGVGAAKTSDPGKVTCKRCRGALGLPPL